MLTYKIPINGTSCIQFEQECCHVLGYSLTILMLFFYSTMPF